MITVLCDYCPQQRLMGNKKSSIFGRPIYTFIREYEKTLNEFRVGLYLYILMNEPEDSESF